MSEGEATRQLNFRDPPLAGNITVITAGAAATFDLSTMDNQTKDPTDSTKLETGADEAYVTFVVDGVKPVYVLFGASAAAVSGGNAPSTSATGTNAAGACVPLFPSPAVGPGAPEYRYKIRKGYNSWIGFYSAGTPNLIIYKSSPYKQAC